MKKIIVFSSLLLIIILFIYFFVGFPFGCKRSGQTYIVGKEKCCFGLDFRPADPGKNICLPKLPKGMYY